MEHQDTKLTSMRPRLKELNDNPYIMVVMFRKLSGLPYYLESKFHYQFQCFL